MATRRKTDPKAARKVAKVMHEFKEGTLESGGSHRKVTDPKQAVAIGLSEARRAGARVALRPEPEQRMTAPHRSAPLAPPPVPGSVAGEEDPEAALDVTGVPAVPPTEPTPQPVADPPPEPEPAPPPIQDPPAPEPPPAPLIGASGAAREAASTVSDSLPTPAASPDRASR